MPLSKEGSPTKNTPFDQIIPSDIVSLNRVLTERGFSIENTLREQKSPLQRPFREVRSLLPRDEKIRKRQEFTAVNQFLYVIEQSLNNQLPEPDEGNNVQAVTHWLIKNHTETLLEASEKFLSDKTQLSSIGADFAQTKLTEIKDRMQKMQEQQKVVREIDIFVD